MQLMHVLQAYVGGTTHVNKTSWAPLSDEYMHVSALHRLVVMDSKADKRRCRNSFFGLLIDESTDIAIHKSMTMYIRHVHNGKIMPIC